MYSKETLAAKNPIYLSEHKYMFGDYEVNKVNEAIRHIELSRSKTEPKPGDIVIFTDKNGIYNPRAHLNKIDEEGAYICESGSCPYIGLKSNGISCDASGGPWRYIPAKKLVYKGKTQQTFWIWGSTGPMGHGGIYFDAEVSLWEYAEDGNPYLTDEGTPYTTKDYECWLIHEYKDWNATLVKLHNINTAIGLYDIRITKSEFEEFVKNYRGKIFGDNEKQPYVVWTWKREEKQIAPDEFEKLPYDEKSEIKLLYGTRYEKRHYNEDTHTIKVFYCVKKD